MFVSEKGLTKLNTCPECGHYSWAHTSEGCPVIENKYDRSSGRAVCVGQGPCECTRTAQEKH